MATDLRATSVRLDDGTLLQDGDVVLVTRTRPVTRLGQDVDKAHKFTGTFKYLKNGAAYIWRAAGPGAGWRTAALSELRKLEDGDELLDPRTAQGLTDWVLSNTGVPDEFEALFAEPVMAESSDAREAWDALVDEASKDEIDFDLVTSLAAAYLSAYEDFYEEALS